MTSNIVEITEEAEHKFGVVEVIAKRIDQLQWILKIKRREPSIESLPYMTIIGYITQYGWVSFYGGNYDISEQSAMDDCIRYMQVVISEVES